MLKHGVLPLVISTIALSLFLKESVKDFYSSQAQPFPALVPAIDIHVFGAVISTQSLAVLGVAIVTVVALHLLAQQDAARPLDASDRAKPDAGAHPRHPGAADGALHLSHQRRARRHRLDPDQPDLSCKIHQRRDAWHWRRSLAAIIGGFNQVRGAILGGVILGVLDNLSAAYLSSQYRGAFPLLISDRSDPAAAARACSAASRSARYEPPRRRRGRRRRAFCHGRCRSFSSRSASI